MMANASDDYKSIPLIGHADQQWDVLQQATQRADLLEKENRLFRLKISQTEEHSRQACAHRDVAERDVARLLSHQNDTAASIVDMKSEIAHLTSHNRYLTEELQRMRQGPPNELKQFSGRTPRGHSKPLLTDYIATPNDKLAWAPQLRPDFPKRPDYEPELPGGVPDRAIGDFLYSHGRNRIHELNIKALLIQVILHLDLPEPDLPQVLVLSNKASKFAHYLKNIPLIGRCAFYRGRAEYGLRDWRGALQSFKRAKTCKGRYSEGELLSLWIKKASKKLAETSEKHYESHPAFAQDLCIPASFGYEFQDGGSNGEGPHMDGWIAERESMFNVDRWSSVFSDHSRAVTFVNGLLQAYSALRSNHSGSEGASWEMTVDQPTVLLNNDKPPDHSLLREVFTQQSTESQSPEQVEQTVPRTQVLSQTSLPKNSKPRPLLAAPESTKLAVSGSGEASVTSLPQDIYERCSSKDAHRTAHELQVLEKASLETARSFPSSQKDAAKLGEEQIQSRYPDKPSVPLSHSHEHAQILPEQHLLEASFVDTRSTSFDQKENRRLIKRSDCSLNGQSSGLESTTASKAIGETDAFLPLRRCSSRAFHCPSPQHPQLHQSKPWSDRLERATPLIAPSLVPTSDASVGLRLTQSARSNSLHQPVPQAFPPAVLSLPETSRSPARSKLHPGPLDLDRQRSTMSHTIGQTPKSAPISRVLAMTSPSARMPSSAPAISAPALASPRARHRKSYHRSGMSIGESVVDALSGVFRPILAATEQTDMEEGLEDGMPAGSGDEEQGRLECRSMAVVADLEAQTYVNRSMEHET